MRAAAPDCHRSAFEPSFALTGCVNRSSSASTSGDSVRPIPRSDSSSCAGVRVPTMTRGHARLRGGPRQGHVSHRHALRLGEPRDAIDRREHLGLRAGLAMTRAGAVAAEVARAPPRQRDFVGAAPASGEKTLHQRHVGRHADTVLAAGGQDLELDDPVEQAIPELIHLDRNAGGERLCQLRRPEIAHADGPDLAFGPQIRQRRKRVCDGIVSDRPVHHVDVDGVDAQPAQAGLAVLAERRRLGVLRADLCADDRFGPTASQRPAQRGFTATVVVPFGGVEVVDTALERLRDDRGIVTVVVRSPIIAFLAAK